MMGKTAFKVIMILDGSRYSVKTAIIQILKNYLNSFSSCGEKKGFYFKLIIILGVIKYRIIIIAATLWTEYLFKSVIPHRRRWAGTTP